MGANGAPEGWHPDPENPASSQRWWDGAQWTGYPVLLAVRAVRRKESLAPLAVVAAVVAVLVAFTALTHL